MASWLDWDKIEEAPSLHARPFLSALYPPASSADLAVLRDQGVHESILESYARHDGSRRHGGLMSGLSPPQLYTWTRVTRWHRLKDVRFEIARIAHRISLPRGWLVLARLRRYDPRVDREDPSGRPVLAGADGVLWALDEGPDGLAALQPISPGQSWVDVVGAVMHSLLSAGFRGVHDWEVDHLEAPFQKAIHPKPPPASPGQSFLALLVEQGALVLRAAPSAELLARLDKALRRRDHRAAARDIAGALRAAAPGTELALSEAQLVALLELF